MQVTVEHLGGVQFEIHARQPTPACFRGLLKTGLLKPGLVKTGLVKTGLVKTGLVKTSDAAAALWP